MSRYETTAAIVAASVAVGGGLEAPAAQADQPHANLSNDRTGEDNFDSVEITSTGMK